MHKTSYEQKWSHFSNVQLDDSAQKLNNLQFLNLKQKPEEELRVPKCPFEIN